MGQVVEKSTLIKRPFSSVQFIEYDAKVKYLSLKTDKGPRSNQEAIRLGGSFKQRFNRKASTNIYRERDSENKREDMFSISFFERIVSWEHCRY